MQAASRNLHQQSAAPVLSPFHLLIPFHHSRKDGPGSGGLCALQSAYACARGGGAAVDTAFVEECRDLGEDEGIMRLTLHFRVESGVTGKACAENLGQKEAFRNHREVS